MATARRGSYGTGVLLEPGLTGSATLEVASADSATALGSGDLPVLGTPRVVALCEQATVDAIAAYLEPGQTTVGVRVELEHHAPTPIGGLVRVEAELIGVKGRSLTFAVVAHDERATIATGQTVRVVVDRSRFVKSLSR